MVNTFWKKDSFRWLEEWKRSLPWMQRIWARVTAERTGRGGGRWGGRRGSKLAATELLSQEMPHAARRDMEASGVLHFKITSLKVVIFLKEHGFFPPWLFLNVALRWSSSHREFSLEGALWHGAGQHQQCSSATHYNILYTTSIQEPPYNYFSVTGI